MINRKEYAKAYYLKNRKKLIRLATMRNKTPEGRQALYLSIKKWKKARPWLKTLENIRYRCNNPNDIKYKYYGGKGIRCLLTPVLIYELWVRDNASTMKQASIDRIDVNGNYEVSNCRFIEMSENRLKRRPAWSLTVPHPYGPRQKINKEKP